ncbi:MAG: hypothetical protein IAF58_21430 [Leptolyngbya sp.]|nr:hypothetical protein [Candidatus Melainabacteria bacterium]
MVASDTQNSPEKLIPAKLPKETDTPAHINLAEPDINLSFLHAQKANLEKSNALKDFDLSLNAFQIADASAPQGPEVVGTMILNGRVVRKDMSEGPDQVIWYDKQGNSHAVLDQRITRMPVDIHAGIHPEREEQLARKANDILYAGADRSNLHLNPKPIVGFNSVANMMDAVAGSADLTEREKCNVWSRIVGGLKSDKYYMTAKDANPAVVDSWLAGDVWHAVIPMNDSYHGDRLINLPRDRAINAILNHELGGEANHLQGFTRLKWLAAQRLLGPNQGDIESSRRQLNALDVFLKDGFSGYSWAWRRLFVE